MSAPKPSKSELIDKYGKLVWHVARKLRQRFRMRMSDEELYQMGMLGLLEAYERFDPDQGVELSSFAYYRIRGAMLDGIRDNEGLSRGQLRLIKRARAANAFAESVSESFEGRESAEDDAAYLEQAVAGAILTADFSELDEERTPAETDGETGYASTPERVAERRELREALRRVLDQMPHDEAYLLEQHYFHDRALSDIGRELGYSRSWACRMHARCIDRARRLMDAPVSERLTPTVIIPG